MSGGKGFEGKGSEGYLRRGNSSCLMRCSVEKLSEAPIKEIAVTDTIPLNDHAKSLGAKIKVLSVSRLLGEAIKRIHTNCFLTYKIFSVLKFLRYPE
jgi:hypothetical protein